MMKKYKSTIVQKNSKIVPILIVKQIVKDKVKKNVGKYFKPIIKLG